MPTLPEKLAPGIYRVDALAIEHGISVLLIAERDGWVLVDTGVAGSARRIQGALAALGAGPGDLKRIYLTHHHADHIGGLSNLLAWSPQVEVIAPEREAPIIAGDRPPDRRENALLQFLSERQRLPTNPIARTVREGDMVGGCRVVATPGHTLGHTSLLQESHGLLMAADAFGRLLTHVQVGVMKAFCTDPAAAKRSAGKLLGYEYDTVVMSHGPLLRDDAKRRLREVVERNTWT